MAACDRAGNFRAEIVEYGLKATDKDDSKSVAVSFRVLLTAWWDGAQWVDWLPYEMECYGDSWIVKKDGTINERAVADLCKHCGWDGALSTIANSTWKPMPLQVEVKPHVYKNETSYRVEWINAFDSTPGAGLMGNVDDDKLRELEARFGAPLRALQGNVRRNVPAATGSRPAPPPPKTLAGAGAGNSDGMKF